VKGGHGGLRATPGRKSTIIAAHIRPNPMRGGDDRTAIVKVASTMSDRRLDRRRVGADSWMMPF